MHPRYAVESSGDFEPPPHARTAIVPRLTAPDGVACRTTQSQISEQGASTDLNSGEIIDCNEHHNTCKSDSLNCARGAIRKIVFWLRKIGLGLRKIVFWLRTRMDPQGGAFPRRPTVKQENTDRLSVMLLHEQGRRRCARHSQAHLPKESEGLYGSSDAAQTERGRGSSSTAKGQQ